MQCPRCRAVVARDSVDCSTCGARMLALVGAMAPERWQAPAPVPEPGETPFWSPAPVGQEFLPPSTLRMVKPIAGLSTALVVLLGATGVLHLLNIVAGLSFRSALGAILADPLMSDAVVNRSMARYGNATGLTSVALLVTAVVFVVWFFRLARNAVSLGANDLRHSSGWAVGAWFVPVLNLFRPKQIADDLWRASAPGLPARATALWQDVPRTGRVTAWWTAWLLGWFLTNGAQQFLASATLYTEMTVGVGIAIAADLVMVAAAGCAILVVRRLTDRQIARARTFVGWTTGLEPATTGTTSRGSTN